MLISKCVKWRVERMIGGLSGCGNQGMKRRAIDEEWVGSESDRQCRCRVKFNRINCNGLMGLCRADLADIHRCRFLQVAGWGEDNADVAELVALDRVGLD